MKIEIDTNRDSEHELRAALRLLQDILGQGYRKRRGLPRDRVPTALELAERAAEEPQEPRPSKGMFSMFDTPPSTGSDEPEPEDDPDLKYYDDEVPRIEPY